MNQMSPPEAPQTALALADTLSDALNTIDLATFEPDARKTLRLFPAGEVADLIGVTPQFLRGLHGEGRIPDASDSKGGRRLYSAADIHAIRVALEENARGNKGAYIRGRRPGDKLQVFTIMNFKGGSGKSTTALTLAHRLALASYRVLCIDLDPQATLTSTFGFRPVIDLQNIHTIYDAVRYDEPVTMRDVIQSTYFHNIDIACADLQLQSFEHETAAVLGDKSKRDVPFYQRLAMSLGDVADDYDIVLMDAPPQLGFLTIAGAVASTSVIVPTTASMLDVSSTSQFLRMTGELLEIIQGQGVTMRFDNFRFLVTRYEPNEGPQQDIMATLRKLFSGRVMKNAVLKSTAISTAALSKQSIYEIPRTSIHRNTYDRARENMDAVVMEVDEMIQQAWGR